MAVTRAKDELILVHPLAAFDRYGIVVVTEPSRFLRELPEDALRALGPGAGPPALVGLTAPACAAARRPDARRPDPDEPVN